MSLLLLGFVWLVPEGAVYMQPLKRHPACHCVKLLAVPPHARPG